MTINDRLIAGILARVRARQRSSAEDLQAVELELRTKWGRRPSYASKVVRRALELPWTRSEARSSTSKPDNAVPEWRSTGPNCHDWASTVGTNSEPQSDHHGDW